MKGLPARTQGIAAAGLMAVLVLSVFANETYSGPESAIFEFHFGAMTGQEGALQSSSLQDYRSGTARSLQEQIRRLMSQRPEVRITGVQHSGRRATVDVLYVKEGAWIFGMRYYLQKPVGRWLVDTDTTWTVATAART